MNAETEQGRHEKEREGIGERFLVAQRRKAGKNHGLRAASGRRHKTNRTMPVMVMGRHHKIVSDDAGDGHSSGIGKNTSLRYVG